MNSRPSPRTSILVLSPIRLSLAATRCCAVESCSSSAMRCRSSSWSDNRILRGLPERLLGLLDRGHVVIDHNHVWFAVAFEAGRTELEPAHTFPLFAMCRPAAWLGGGPTARMSSPSLYRSQPRGHWHRSTSSNRERWFGGPPVARAGQPVCDRESLPGQVCCDNRSCLVENHDVRRQSIEGCLQERARAACIPGLPSAARYCP